MKKSNKIITAFVFSTSLLLVMPGVALADHNSPHVGINLMFGVPIYEQPAYVYAPQQPVYVYSQPRGVYYQRGYDNQYYRGYEEDHRQWRDHGEHHRHHDEEDDD